MREESEKGRGEKRPGPFLMKRRKCRFCMDGAPEISYRDPRLLRLFLSDRGKILPARLSGNCAKHQRRVTRALKQARILAFLPFTKVGH